MLENNHNHNHNNKKKDKMQTASSEDEAQPPPPSLWLSLPAELLQEIWSHLPFREMYRMGAVCKLWHHYCTHDNVRPWKAVYDRLFAGPPNAKDERTWKQRLQQVWSHYHNTVLVQQLEKEIELQQHPSPRSLYPNTTIPTLRPTPFAPRFIEFTWYAPLLFLSHAMCGRSWRDALCIPHVPANLLVVVV